MVTIISDTITTIHFILTCVIIVGLLSLIILLDYYKMTKKKKLIGTIIAVLLVCGCAVLGIITTEAVFMIRATTDDSTRILTHIIALLTGMVFVGALLTIIILESIKKNLTKRTIYSILFTILALIGVALVTAVIIIMVNNFGLIDPPLFQIPNNSLHIGSIIGFPALFLLSVGTILVIYDEPKFVLYHGLTAGSAWLLTTLNVVLLFTLTGDQMTGYSGIIHTAHIICGATGLLCGFLSALGGISGQRKLAKITGYITLGCWWVAYMLATFIVNV